MNVEGGMLLERNNFTPVYIKVNLCIFEESHDRAEHQCNTRDD